MPPLIYIFRLVSHPVLRATIRWIWTQLDSVEPQWDQRDVQRHF